jgi:transposase
VGLDRKTVRRYLERGLEAPVYGPREPRPRLLEPFEGYLRERISAYPGLSGSRLLREIKELGYRGGYTAVTDFLRAIRPPQRPMFERRFETPPGRQAQVDFAQFRVAFTNEPGVTRIVWLFTMVLGSSRWLWGRFSASQDLQTVLRHHIDAFTAMKGAPSEVLYDRMKTAVIDEDADGRVIYNSSLAALLGHYGAVPRACRPYRAKTKGKVERPYAQFDRWRCEVANARTHATTGRVVAEAFADEQPALIALPAIAYSAVLSVERRVSHEGMVSVGGNLYSVPDSTRRRMVEVQHHPKEIRIFEDGRLIASHLVLEGKNLRRVDPRHRQAPPPRQKETPVKPGVARRPLDFYGAVGQRLAAEAGR